MVTLRNCTAKTSSAVLTFAVSPRSLPPARTSADEGRDCAFCLSSPKYELRSATELGWSMRSSGSRRAMGIAAAWRSWPPCCFLSGHCGRRRPRTRLSDKQTVEHHNPCRSHHRVRNSMYHLRLLLLRTPTEVLAPA